jgi:ankyrin repeat protein
LIIGSNSIDNPKECINKIKAEFNLKNQQIDNIKKNSLKYEREDLDINDSNFLKVVAEKVEYYKKNYLDKNKQEEIKDDNIDKQLRKLINPSSNLTSDKNKTKRRFEILKSNLIFLRDNHITIEEFTKNNPINIKPFQFKESIDFLDAVKYDKFDVIENMLHNNKSLLFCFDYLHHTAFHWAAKRNKIKAMKILLTYGKCVNLVDNNKMTPLHLAAQNNFYDAVQILCDNGANPLMENIDGKKPSELSSDFRIRSFLNSAEDMFPIGLKNRIKQK